MAFTELHDVLLHFCSLLSDLLLFDGGDELLGETHLSNSNVFQLDVEFSRSVDLQS